MTPPSTWLTLPTYNEVGNVRSVVLAVVEQMRKVAPGDFEVLVVDDGSPDGTGDVADALAAEVPEVSVLHREVKQGLGAAYLAGFVHALAGGAERVVVMDADFSHDPAFLPAILEAARTHDLVLGSRYVQGGEIVNWPPLRRLLSRGGSLYARTILGVGIRDLTGGFRCVSRELLEGIDLDNLRAQGYVFNIELTYRALRAGYRVVEVPIKFRDREAGASKMSLPIAFEALLLVPRLRREVRRGLAPPASAATAADPVPAAPADEEMASTSEPSG